VGALPKAQSYLQQADGLIQPVGWLAGVDGPRHFLVEELDSTELRATGGFSGQYGILSVQDGKIAPFSLLAVNTLDYGGNGWAIHSRPPAAYAWWPIANWGLRNANLNADFPTNARLEMNVYRCETAKDPSLCTVSDASTNDPGSGVDGLIQFTPTAIDHVLQVAGPLVVPLYNETVTAGNLEDKIHFYQLTQAGAQRNQQICLQQGGSKDTCGPSSDNVRHLFARTLAKALEARLRGLSLKQLVPVAKQAFKDMQAHDIQMYVTNDTLESLLLQHSAGGAISTQPGVDGFMVVHTNWSAGKINDHIRSLEQDDVTLDDKGGATHHLTIQVTNYDANIIPKDHTNLWDYLRVYAPKGAKLLGAGGFQTTTQLCLTSACPSNPYPGALTCPYGGYGHEGRTPTVFRVNDNDPPMMTLGGPTNATSDVPNLTMWGGNIFVPLGCTMTVTLSWYATNVAAPSSAVPAGAPPYTELIQRQGGTVYEARVTLHPAPHVASEGTKTVAFDVTLSTDLRFTFGAAPQAPAP
jgi:hypothetical protein